LDDARSVRTDAARHAARLEGQIEVVEKTSQKANVPASEVSRLIDEGEKMIEGPSVGDSGALISFLRDFVGKLRSLIRNAEEGVGDLSRLRFERNSLIKEEQKAATEEKDLAAQLESIRNELDQAREKEREKERDLFELAAKEREARHETATLRGDFEKLTLEEEEFKREIAEAAVLFGKDILLYTDEKVDDVSDRKEQEKEKRELEKVKIRLEEMGSSESEDVLKEYREVSERDEFLERELKDLSSAASSLKELIVDLEKELSVKFNDGVDAINKEFTTLFSLMFDGGSASLIRVKEPVRGNTPLLSDEDSDEPALLTSQKEEFSEGIDIALSIPRKRIKSLVMLSGGERALTSIALIFAMSSVNPPPFLILDETDAALDESNSRRYGDMVAALAKKSQLVLITHNRETMSRAGILYGVTMGGDGVSKVLSVKLEEAVKVAK
jgi:chromosome segregation protein